MVLFRCYDIIIMDNNERKLSMAKNRNNRFDKIREKIDKRTPSRRKIKEKDYSTENTFMADAFPVVIIFSLIACCALF